MDQAFSDLNEKNYILCSLLFSSLISHFSFSLLPYSVLHRHDQFLGTLSDLLCTYALMACLFSLLLFTKQFGPFLGTIFFFYNRVKPDLGAYASHVFGAFRRSICLNTWSTMQIAFRLKSAMPNLQLFQQCWNKPLTSTSATILALLDCKIWILDNPL